MTAANVQAFSTVAALRAFGQNSGTNVISYVKADSDGTAGLYSYDTTGATIKHQYVMDGDTGSLAGYVGGAAYYFMRTTNVDSAITFFNKYKIANATPPSDGAAYAMTWTNNAPSFTKVMSGTADVSVTIVKTAHGFSKWEPIWWDGAQWITPTNDPMVAVYVVMLS